ncbi:MAG: hypothetical protein LBU77_00030 [Clostridiales bacterium]|jgi:hypothetical protein|nr:hypothetical protein [Clostridiales bacterium]
MANRFVIDPNAKEMTADIACRTFLSMSEAELVKQLQIYGNDYFDMAEKAKAGRKRNAIQMHG